MNRRLATAASSGRRQMPEFSFLLTLERRQGSEAVRGDRLLSNTEKVLPVFKGLAGLVIFINWRNMLNMFKGNAQAAVLDLSFFKPDSLLPPRTLEYFGNQLKIMFLRNRFSKTFFLFLQLSVLWTSAVVCVLHVDLFSNSDACSYSHTSLTK